MKYQTIIVILILSLISVSSYSQQVIRCADPECSICLTVPDAVSPEKSDTREPRDPPEDVPFGRSASLAVVNPVLRSPYQTAISLAGDWEFCTDPDTIGVKEQWMHPDAAWPSIVAMPVPSNWESHGIGEPGWSTPWNAHWDQMPRRLQHTYIGSAWYRKTITVPADWKGKRIWLKIGGVRAQGWFWVNGIPVARQFSYCGTYKYDITDLVKPGKTSVIVAQVRNDVPSRMGLVSACHTWGGIYRDVELEATPKIFLSNVECSGNFDAKNVDVHCKLEHPHNVKGKIVDVEIRLRLFDPLRTIDTPNVELAKKRFTIQLGENASTMFTHTITPTEFHPWTPEIPNLYVAEVTLYERNRKTPIHGWIERFGVKKMEVRRDRFYLNGKPYFLRGYGDDYVYPLTFISPTDRDTHRANFSVAREAGFNYVRLHTHNEIPEYYDAADELGIMIQPELPYYPFNGFHTVESFDFDPKRDLNELIDHYRRHVSLTTYCMGNEGHLGTPLDHELKTLVYERDPGRLVMHNDGGVNTPENSDFYTPNSGPMIRSSSITPWDPGTFDYLKMPFVAHEYLNLGLKFDPRISDRFTGVMMPPRPIDVYEKQIADFGIDRSWGDACIDAGHALQKYYQKQGLEAARMDPQCDGYHLWTLVDVIVKYGGEYDFTGQGLFNPFWEAKSNGATPKDFIKFNGPTVILMHLDSSNYPIFSEGDTIRASIFISHFGFDDLKNESVSWTIQSGNTVILDGVIDDISMQTGDLKRIGHIEFVVPHRNHAEHWRLVTQLRNGISNDWDLWIFPKRQKKSLKGFAVSSHLYDLFAEYYDDLLLAGTPEGSLADIVIGTPDSPEITNAIAEEKRVVIIGNADGPPNVKLGWWWIGDQTGTAFAHHPAFGNFPHDGYINPLWFRLIKKGIPITTPMPFKKMEYLAVGEGRDNYFMYVAQTTVGEKGRILMLHGLDILSGTPEATYLLDQMLQYVDSEAFRPQ